MAVQYWVYCHRGTWGLKAEKMVLLTHTARVRCGAQLSVSLLVRSPSFYSFVTFSLFRAECLYLFCRVHFSDADTRARARCWFYDIPLLWASLGQQSSQSGLRLVFSECED